uniref:Ge1_WD40 domain-containing protein n=1 Tax=Gongylonema pulchrum TaxID=637853 RepID=A0A183DCU3_9BILA
LSPDTTAVAVALDGGIVSFFIMDNEGTKFAHRWQPERGRDVQDLVFLDNISGSDTSYASFWLHSLA